MIISDKKDFLTAAIDHLSNFVWCDVSIRLWIVSSVFIRKTINCADRCVQSNDRKYDQQNSLNLWTTIVHCALAFSLHCMMTSSNGNIFRVTGHLSSVISPHKGQWRGALIFLWFAPWINGWVSNREAGDLRRHRAHYDVIVMIKCFK